VGTPEKWLHFHSKWEPKAGQAKSKTDGPLAGITGKNGLPQVAVARRGGLVEKMGQRAKPHVGARRCMGAHAYPDTFRFRGDVREEMHARILVICLEKF
jgi:hypothetical protein